MGIGVNFRSGKKKKMKQIVKKRNRFIQFIIWNSSCHTLIIFNEKAIIVSISKSRFILNGN